jgi:alkylation response protein AidB-like acyl-CoA dehydrogenase
MNLTLTAEQQDLRETVAKFLAAKAPLSAQRALFDTESGFDPAVWSQLTEQLGLIGLVIPETYGGLGFGPVELSLVLHEMGRTLYSGPYLPSVLAATALLHIGDRAACNQFLPDIASGETIATLAWAEADGQWAATDVATTARKVGDDWVVDGTKTLVLAVPAADLFLVTARTAAGTGLFAVQATPGVVEATVLETLDLTRRLGMVRFAAARARLLGRVEETSAVLASVLDVAYAALAAEQSGGAWQCLEMSVEYAKTREQFGAVIGSYQAVAHACADMLLRAEHARSAAHYAAAAAGTAEFPIAARVASVYAAQAYDQITTATIHLHGGIAFTWEHDAHLYYRRARSSALLFGHSDRHFEAVAALVGL